MGTGASGGNAGDGNSITSPRIGGEICCDDEDAIKHYADKNVGYGAMGNHTSGMEKNKGSFNRSHREPKNQQKKRGSSKIVSYVCQAIKVTKQLNSYERLKNI